MRQRVAGGTFPFPRLRLPWVLRVSPPPVGAAGPAPCSQVPAVRLVLPLAEQLSFLPGPLVFMVAYPRSSARCSASAPPPGSCWAPELLASHPRGVVSIRNPAASSCAPRLWAPPQSGHMGESASDAAERRTADWWLSLRLRGTTPAARCRESPRAVSTGRVEGGDASRWVNGERCCLCGSVAGRPCRTSSWPACPFTCLPVSKSVHDSSAGMEGSLDGAQGVQLHSRPVGRAPPPSAAAQPRCSPGPPPPESLPGQPSLSPAWQACAGLCSEPWSWRRRMPEGLISRRRGWCVPRRKALSWSWWAKRHQMCGHQSQLLPKQMHVGTLQA